MKVTYIPQIGLKDLTKEVIAHTGGNYMETYLFLDDFIFVGDDVYAYNINIPDSPEGIEKFDPIIQTAYKIIMKEAKLNYGDECTIYMDIND